VDAAHRARAWRAGRTGVPLVDAAMRELRATGWMQQSARMAAAAYLVNVLRVPWLVGRRHFADFLIDHDPAINAMMWANAGGAGVDPWAFSLGCARALDPDGAYVRRWVPELARLANYALHAPWSAGSAELADAGVTLGESYPHRLVADELAAKAERAAGVRAARLAVGHAMLDPSSGYDLIAVPSRALEDGGRAAGAVPGAALVLVKVYTLPETRGEKPQPRARPRKGPPPAPLRYPKHRTTRVVLKEAPVVGKGAADRDRGSRRLRSYANAGVDDVRAMEED
jgi:hypothetical protein